MKFLIYQDLQLQWRWNLKSRDGEIIAVSSQGYEALHQCEQAIFLVQGASRADIEIDLTQVKN